jgi:antitoxin (DNA-binding transcriptional repressor) of toxin-antitoxin stability system
VDSIAISKFKATCLAVLKKVKRTRQPIRVTRFGETVAEIVPPSTPAGRTHLLGSLQGTARIVGDIVSPASDEADWEALR